MQAWKLLRDIHTVNTETAKTSYLRIITCEYYQNYTDTLGNVCGHHIATVHRFLHVISMAKWAHTARMFYLKNYWVDMDKTWFWLEGVLHTDTRGE
jgi:hypothetical protein